VLAPIPSAGVGFKARGTEIRAKYAIWKEKIGANTAIFSLAGGLACVLWCMRVQKALIVHPLKKKPAAIFSLLTRRGTRAKTGFK